VIPDVTVYVSAVESELHPIKVYQVVVPLAPVPASHYNWYDKILDPPISAVAVRATQFAWICEMVVLVPLEGVFIIVGIVLIVAPAVFVTETTLQP
jgi:hypothetical protein